MFDQLLGNCGDERLSPRNDQLDAGSDLTKQLVRAGVPRMALQIAEYVPSRLQV